MAQVTVDFSVLGIDSVDITTANNPAGYTLNGVTFKYDDLGSGVDTAQVDAVGIFGSTFGSLIFDFDAPATALNFDFTLSDAAQSASDALFIAFKSNGSDVTDMLIPAIFTPYDPGDPTVGLVSGALAYNGAEFNQAVMIFSPDVPFFSVENISYVPVPEPSSFVILACGLVGLGGLGRFARRS